MILDIHELTIEAIMKRNRKLLVRALSIDPLVNSIATARLIIDELFAREKEALLDWPEEEEEITLSEELSRNVDPPALQLF